MTPLTTKAFLHDKGGYSLCLSGRTWSAIDRTWGSVEKTEKNVSLYFMGIRVLCNGKELSVAQPVKAAKKSIWPLQVFYFYWNHCTYFCSHASNKWNPKMLSLDVILSNINLYLQLTIACKHDDFEHLGTQHRFKLFLARN